MAHLDREAVQVYWVVQDHEAVKVDIYFIVYLIIFKKKNIFGLKQAQGPASFFFFLLNHQNYEIFTN